MGKRVQLSGIAKAFGMSVVEFADFLGYSRPALYDFEVTKRNKRRVEAAKELLKAKSQQMRSVEISAAEIRFLAREEAIRQFEIMMLGGGGDKQNGNC